MDRLTAMETLVSVIEADSLSDGVHLLDVGQPAASRSIVQLEERLGETPGRFAPIVRWHPRRPCTCVTMALAECCSHASVRPRPAR